MNDPKNMENVKKIVLAGMRLLYDEKTAELRKAMLTRKSPVPEMLATNVTGLMKIMWEKSKGALPPGAIGPAAIMLIYELASFIREAGKPIKQEDVEIAVPITMQMLRELFMGEGDTPGQEGEPPQPDQSQTQPQAAPQGLLAAQGA